MSHETEFELQIHEIVEQGFPCRPEFLAFLQDYEGPAEIHVQIYIDSHGYSGNNWDDPGAGAEWTITEIHIPTQFHHFFPVTDEMNRWLEEHLNDRVQLWDAEQGLDGPDEY